MNSSHILSVFNGIPLGASKNTAKMVFYAFRLLTNLQISHNNIDVIMFCKKHTSEIHRWKNVSIL